MLKSAISLAGLEDSTPIAADVDGVEVFVVRLGDKVYALANICTHAESWLDMGTVHADRLEIECPLHGGRFDLRTGAATREPCVQPIATYPVQVRDRTVYVDVSGASS